MAPASNSGGDGIVSLTDSSGLHPHPVGIDFSCPLPPTEPAQAAQLRHLAVPGPQVREVLIAVFESQRVARRALEDLHALGFDTQQLGLAVRSGRPARESVPGSAAPPTVGPAAMTPAPSVPLDLHTHMVPGFGYVTTAGILLRVGQAPVDMSAPTAEGREPGLLIRVLRELQIPADEARRTEDEFRVGRAVIVVRPAQRCDDAIRTLRQHGAHLNTHTLPHRE